MLGIARILQAWCTRCNLPKVSATPPLTSGATHMLRSGFVDVLCLVSGVYCLSSLLQPLKPQCDRGEQGKTVKTVLRKKKGSLRTAPNPTQQLLLDLVMPVPAVLLLESLRQLRVRLEPHKSSPIEVGLQKPRQAWPKPTHCYNCASASGCASACACVYACAPVFARASAGACAYACGCASVSHQPTLKRTYLSANDLRGVSNWWGGGGTVGGATGTETATLPIAMQLGARAMGLHRMPTTCQSVLVLLVPTTSPC